MRGDNDGAGAAGGGIVSGQMPLALVYGEPMREPPAALYIPPAAMRVMSDHFTGPMDLLLYLVRRHRFDILDMPMAALCRQYSAYVEEALQDENNLETAADYLAMAALLLDIKSKMLLPKPPPTSEEEEDPRADLVRRLLEYERIREAAQQIGEMPRRERDFISPHIAVELPPAPTQKPPLYPALLSAALASALLRARQLSPYRPPPRNINLRAMMSDFLRRLSSSRALSFFTLARASLPGASLMAVLQLAAESAVWLRQKSAGDELFVKLRGERGGEDERDGQAGD